VRWDSSAGIATDYGLDDRGSIPCGDCDSSLYHRVQTCFGAHQASYPMGTGCSSLEVKRPAREADHSPQSSAESKNAWSYTSTPQYVLTAWCSVKHRDNFLSRYARGKNADKDGHMTTDSRILEVRELYFPNETTNDTNELNSSMSLN
jgi:hypothetical protein